MPEKFRKTRIIIFFTCQTWSGSIRKQNCIYTDMLLLSVLKCAFNVCVIRIVLKSDRASALWLNFSLKWYIQMPIPLGTQLAEFICLDTRGI